MDNKQPTYDQLSEAIARTWYSYIMAYNAERAQQWAVSYMLLHDVRNKLYPDSKEEGESPCT